jgi:hypothetical protein
MKKINTERFRRTVYQRDASYAPIPFAKRLRVVWTGKVEDIHFYQLQVRLYPEGTPMKSFSSKDILTYRKIIDRVTMVLSDPDLSIPSLPEDSVKTFEAALEPSEKKVVLHLDGQKAVGKFTLRLDAKDMDKARFCRSSVTVIPGARCCHRWVISSEPLPA